MKRYEQMSDEEKTEMILKIISGDSEAREALADTAIEEMERTLIEPARQHQTDTGSVRSLDFGRPVLRRLRQNAGVGGAHTQGMVMGLLELALRKDRYVRAYRYNEEFYRQERKRLREESSRLRGLIHNDLDLAAVQADRDDLATRVAVLQRELTEARGRITQLEETILRMDIEMTESRRPADVQVPLCENCMTTIGWTRAINGHEDCESCALDAAKSKGN